MSVAEMSEHHPDLYLEEKNDFLVLNIDFKNDVFIFQEHSKSTQIQVNILPFS